MNKEKFAPPAHLSNKAKAIWLEIVPANARTAGRLALLTTALESLDICDKAQAALEGQSLTTKTMSTGTIHVNPLLRVLKESRAQFASIWHSLGLSNYGADHMYYSQWLEQQAKKEREQQP